MVNDDIERLKIHNRMMYVLTGDEQYQKVSQIASAKMTHQKMQERKYRKRKGGYFRRPDRSLNEKKKRRASAQKADTMESEQEQPLMVERPLKAADDEPMEVDQIHQDEA